MGHALGNGHFGHCYRRVERFSAVIKTGKDVAMNVDHSEKA
jgi:hypothetical protein